MDPLGNAGPPEWHAVRPRGLTDVVSLPAGRPDNSSLATPAGQAQGTPPTLALADADPAQPQDADQDLVHAELQSSLDDAAMQVGEDDSDTRSPGQELVPMAVGGTSDLSMTGPSSAGVSMSVSFATLQQLQVSGNVDALFREMLAQPNLRAAWQELVTLTVSTLELRYRAAVEARDRQHAEQLSSMRSEAVSAIQQAASAAQGSSTLVGAIEQQYHLAVQAWAQNHSEMSSAHELQLARLREDAEVAHAGAISQLRDLAAGEV